MGTVILATMHMLSHNHFVSMDIQRELWISDKQRLKAV
jgi:hypothetical protein